MSWGSLEHIITMPQSSPLIEHIRPCCGCRGQEDTCAQSHTQNAVSKKDPHLEIHSKAFRESVHHVWQMTNNLVAVSNNTPLIAWNTTQQFPMNGPLKLNYWLVPLYTYPVFTLYHILEVKTNRVVNAGGSISPVIVTSNLITANATRVLQL